MRRVSGRLSSPVGGSTTSGRNGNRALWIRSAPVAPTGFHARPWRASLVTGMKPRTSAASWLGHAASNVAYQNNGGRLHPRGQQGSGSGSEVRFSAGFSTTTCQHSRSTRGDEAALGAHPCRDRRWRLLPSASSARPANTHGTSLETAAHVPSGLVQSCHTPIPVACVPAGLPARAKGTRSARALARDRRAPRDAAVAADRFPAVPVRASHPCMIAAHSVRCHALNAWALRGVKARRLMSS